MSLLYDAEVEYEDSEHKYTVEGIEVPSTTTILKDAGFYKNADFYTKEGADKGSYRHKLVEQYFKGTMDWGQVGEHLPYIDALMKAIDELQLVMLKTELKLVNRELWYTGTIDWIGFSNKWETEGFIDWKTGGPDKANDLQLMLYGGLIKKTEGTGGELELPSADIYLQKNGKYKYVECSGNELNRAAAFGSIPGYHFRRTL